LIGIAFCHPQPCGDAFRWFDADAKREPCIDVALHNIDRNAIRRAIAIKG